MFLNNIICSVGYVYISVCKPFRYTDSLFSYTFTINPFTLSEAIQVSTIIAIVSFMFLSKFILLITFKSNWLFCKIKINFLDNGDINYIYIFKYIHISVHRDSILIRSNEIQQYAGVYLLQNYSTCLGCDRHPKHVE